MRSIPRHEAQEVNRNRFVEEGVPSQGWESLWRRAPFLTFSMIGREKEDRLTLTPTRHLAFVSRPRFFQPWHGLPRSCGFQRFFHFPETASGLFAVLKTVHHSAVSLLFSPRCCCNIQKISGKRAYGIPCGIDAGWWERIEEKDDGIGYWKAINLRYRDRRS